MSDVVYASMVHSGTAQRFPRTNNPRWELSLLQSIEGLGLLSLYTSSFLNKHLQWCSQAHPKIIADIQWHQNYSLFVEDPVQTSTFYFYNEVKCRTKVKTKNTW